MIVFKNVKCDKHVCFYKESPLQFKKAPAEQKSTYLFDVTDKVTINGTESTKAMYDFLKQTNFCLGDCTVRLDTCADLSINKDLSEDK